MVYLLSNNKLDDFGCQTGVNGPTFHTLSTKPAVKRVTWWEFQKPRLMLSPHAAFGLKQNCDNSTCRINTKLHHTAKWYNSKSLLFIYVHQRSKKPSFASVSSKKLQWIVPPLLVSECWPNRRLAFANAVDDYKFVSNKVVTCSKIGHRKFTHFSMFLLRTYFFPIPDALCMEYLPTFGIHGANGD